MLRQLPLPNGPLQKQSLVGERRYCCLIDKGRAPLCMEVELHLAALAASVHKLENVPEE